MPILFKNKEKEKVLFGQWFRCTGCNFCIESCPSQALEPSFDVVNDKLAHPPRIKDNAKCIMGRICELVCPHQAIYVVEENNV